MKTTWSALWLMVRNPAVVVLLSVVVAATVAVWTFTEARIEEERALALQAEIDKNANLVLAHAERASRSIQVLDQVLLAVRADYLRHGIPADLGSLVSALWMDPVHAGLVTLIDVQGNPISSTSTTANIHNYADRDYFQYHRSNPEDRVLVGQPIQSRLTGQWVIPLTRRISTPDGGFGGVVFLSISPLFFADEYERVALGPYGSMALIGLDGVTRARRNGDKISFGEDASRSQLFKELPQRPQGHYIGVAASDGVRRLAAYHSLKDYPLVAVVASSYEDVLATTADREHLYTTSARGITLLIVLAGITGVGMVVRRRRVDEAIRALAFYDPLTGLPNRRLLLDRMQVAIASNHRHARRGALLFIDLDHFKVLNDTLGHKKGDELLQLVASRLLTCLREGDTCARFGGDEFVVMLVDLSHDELEAAQQASAAATKLLAVLGKPYELDGAEHHTTPSIGVTLFGDTETTLEDPLTRADLAMYQAKSAGRNAVRFYDPQLQATMAHRAQLEKDIREALRTQQFALHVQPQIHGQGEVLGVEALIRWQHPDKGLISPADFISLAEETGLIVPIGLWVLEEACRQLARWSQDPELGRLHLSVNVSERQFRQVDFVPQVIDILQRTGANASLLRLEITEGLLIVHVDDVVKKMRALKSLGVGFEMDDFGTGYSSLSYLKQLPLDRLKIDQSFVRDVLTDPNDAAIAKMVIVLAESLGLSVIAEGVETESQRAFLEENGCRDYQGYLFGRPMSIKDFEGWVRQR